MEVIKINEEITTRGGLVIPEGAIVALGEFGASPRAVRKGFIPGVAVVEVYGNETLMVNKKEPIPDVKDFGIRFDGLLIPLDDYQNGKQTIGSTEILFLNAVQSELEILFPGKTSRIFVKRTGEEKEVEPVAEG